MMLARGGKFCCDEKPARVSTDWLGPTICRAQIGSRLVVLTVTKRNQLFLSDLWRLWWLWMCFRGLIPLSKLEERMQTQKLRLTTTEDQAYRTRLSRLEELGIPVGCAVDPRPEPDRLMFEQTEGELPAIYELPSDQVV